MSKEQKNQYAIHLWTKAQRQNEKWGLHKGFNGRRNSVYYAVKGRFENFVHWRSTEGIPIPTSESFERSLRELPMLQFVFYNEFFQGAMLNVERTPKWESSLQNVAENKDRV
eukprot:8127755-Ditylum_brightwellii.AAC.1